MNSIRPFLSSESVREKKGNSTVARYILRTGTGSAQARAGIDAMRACLPAEEYRSSLHVQYHPRVEGPSSHHVALHVRVVSASRLRAHTYAHTVIVIQADEQMSTTCALQPKAPCAPLMQEQCPWLLPSPSPPTVLGAHTTRAPLLPPGQPGRLGRQGCPFPPIMGNIGSAYSGGPTGQSHIPGRYLAWPLFASCLCADGPDRPSSASLLRLRKSPHPQTSSKGPASDNISM